MYRVLGTMGRIQKTAVFWPDKPPHDIHVASQTTTSPLALYELHSRSHKRALELVFPNYYCFRKYDTVFLFFNQTKFTFLNLFLYILLDLIIVFPMATSALNSISDRNIEQLLAFVD